jgi:hypothetical protein
MRGFRQIFTIEDAIEVIEFHAFAPLEALPCVCPMPFLSGFHCLLPVGTAIFVETLKARIIWMSSMMSNHTGSNPS